MILLFWNGSGTASGSVKIIPAKATVSVGGGAVDITTQGGTGGSGSVKILPFTGKVGL